MYKTRQSQTYKHVERKKERSKTKNKNFKKRVRTKLKKKAQNMTSKIGFKQTTNSVRKPKTKRKNRTRLTKYRKKFSKLLVNSRSNLN